MLMGLSRGGLRHFSFSEIATAIFLLLHNRSSLFVPRYVMQANEVKMSSLSGRPRARVFCNGQAFRTDTWDTKNGYLVN